MVVAAVSIDGKLSDRIPKLAKEGLDAMVHIAKLKHLIRDGAPALDFGLITDEKWRRENINSSSVRAYYCMSQLMTVNFDLINLNA